MVSIDVVELLVGGFRLCAEKHSADASLARRLVVNFSLADASHFLILHRSAMG